MFELFTAFVMIEGRSSAIIFSLAVKGPQNSSIGGEGLQLLLVEVPKEPGADFHHHPLELVERGGLLGVVVKVEIRL